MLQSSDIGRAALRMALTETRTEEYNLRDRLEKQGIHAVAVNFGGKFLDILPKIYESAIVAAQRQHMCYPGMSKRQSSFYLPFSTLE